MERVSVQAGACIGSHQKNIHKISFVQFFHYFVEEGGRGVFWGSTIMLIIIDEEGRMDG